MWEGGKIKPKCSITSQRLWIMKLILTEDLRIFIMVIKSMTEVIFGGPRVDDLCMSNQAYRKMQMAHSREATYPVPARSIQSIRIYVLKRFSNYTHLAVRGHATSSERKSLNDQKNFVQRR